MHSCTFCEYAISKVTKPYDVVTSMSVQTVEILNTDAEGRLVLLMLNLRWKIWSKVVINTATLTGAVVVALLGVAAGVMGNDQKLVDEIEAGQTTGEKAYAITHVGWVSNIFRFKLCWYC